MRSRGLTSVIEGFIRWRWPRFVLAIIALILGTIFILSAFGDAEVKSGHAVRVGGNDTLTNSSTGAYVSSRINFVGSTVEYFYNRADFTPELTDQAIHASDSAGRVDFWYIDFPFSGAPHLLAIQLYSVDGIPTTKYVTQWYLHPDNMRNSGLRTAAVPLTIALAFGLWGSLVPPLVRRKPTASASER
jgi:hypothetical protein